MLSAFPLVCGHNGVLVLHSIPSASMYRLNSSPLKGGPLSVSQVYFPKYAMSGKYAVQLRDTGFGLCRFDNFHFREFGICVDDN